MAPNSSPRVTPVLAFTGLCVLAIAVAVGYALLIRPASDRESAASAGTAPPADAAAIAAVAARPHLLFRSTVLDHRHGQVGLVPLDQLDAPPVMTDLNCERVHFAAGQGVCLAATRRMLTSYRADLFDGQYRALRTIPVAGVPSRTRVAPGGGMAALTYFVGGDSYAATGFSTRSLLIDWTNAATLANLEAFAVSRQGTRFKAADFNFWGVTFARQPARFFATLASGGKTYLIEGDASARTAKVVREGVECPSLSPDNRRIAFKRRMPGLRVMWQIHVLDLETGVETSVAETRSVDDQVEWLDDSAVIYALPNDQVKAHRSTDIWAAAADGGGTPYLLLANAESPAVVRPQ